MVAIQNVQQLAKLIKSVRKQLHVTQEELALAAGTGLRFIIDLEHGKPTCQIEKVLQVLKMLGIKLTVTVPPFEG